MTGVLSPWGPPGWVSLGVPARARQGERRSSGKRQSLNPRILTQSGGGEMGAAVGTEGHPEPWGGGSQRGEGPPPTPSSPGSKVTCLGQEGGPRCCQGGSDAPQARPVRVDGDQKEAGGVRVPKGQRAPHQDQTGRANQPKRPPNPRAVAMVPTLWGVGSPSVTPASAAVL